MKKQKKAKGHEWEMAGVGLVTKCKTCGLNSVDYALLKTVYQEDILGCPYVSPKLPPPEDTRVNR